MVVLRLKLLFLLTITISLTCWPSFLEGSVLTFGQSCALTGSTASLGINMRRGIEAAFQRANDAGGVHGYTLDLVSLDDQYEPQACVENTLQFLSNNSIFGLIGYVGTAPVQAVLPYVSNYSVPFIGPFTGGSGVRNPFRESVFNIRASYADETASMVNFLINKLQKRRISILSQDDAFGEAGYVGLKSALTAVRVSLKSEAKFPRNTVNVEAAVASIATGHPDAVVIIATYSAASKYIKLSKNSGLYKPDIIFMAISFVGSSEFAEELGDDYYENTYVTQVVPSPEDTSYRAVRDFRDSMALYFPNDHLDFVAFEGFLAAQFTIEILKKLVTMTRANFIETVYEVSEFVYGGLNYGPFLNYCEKDSQCKCNQGIRKVWMTQLIANKTYLYIPSGDWSWTQCKSDPATIKSPILFGQSAALTGASQFMGQSLRAGILSAFQEYNEKGGFNGRALQLLSLDDIYEPARARNNTIELIEGEGVFGLIGFAGTPTTAGVIDLVQKAGLPLIGPYTGSSLLRSPFPQIRNVINIRVSYDDETAAIINYFLNYRAILRVAVFYQNDSFGTSVLDGVKKASAAVGVSIVGLATYERNTLNVESGVPSLLEKEPEAIIVVGTVDPLAKFIKLVRSSNFSNAQTILFATVSFIGSSRFAEVLSSQGTTDGVYITEAVPFPFDSTIPTAAIFVEQLNKTFPEVEISTTTFEGYLAGRLLINILSELSLMSLPLTQSNFIRTVYSGSVFSFGGIQLGPFVDQCKETQPNSAKRTDSFDLESYRPKELTTATDTTTVYCCNQGLRQVSLVNIAANGTLGLISEGQLAFRSTCTVDTSTLKSPIVFGSDTPQDVHSTHAQYQQGIRAAFAITNSGGGINGRRILLKQYRDSDTASFMSNVELMHQRDKVYGLVASGGNVSYVDVLARTNNTFPVIAPQTGNLYTFEKNIIYLRPSLLDEAASIATLLTNFFTLNHHILVVVQSDEPYWVEAYKKFSRYMKTILSKSYRLIEVQQSDLHQRAISSIIQLDGTDEAVVIFSNDEELVEIAKRVFSQSDNCKIVLPYDSNIEYVTKSITESFQDLNDVESMKSRIIVSSVFSEALTMERSPDLYRSYYLYMKDSGYTVQKFDGFMVGVFLVEALGVDSSRSTFVDSLYSQGSFSIAGQTLGPIGRKCENINSHCASLAFCSCNQLIRQVNHLSIVDPETLELDPVYSFSFKTCGVTFPPED